MELRLKNYNKPTNRRLKLIADIALFALTLELPIITTLPVSEDVRFWIGFAVAELTVLFKLISKFTADDTVHYPDPVPLPDVDPEESDTQPTDVLTHRDI
jgi:hypothetical protein